MDGHGQPGSANLLQAAGAFGFSHPEMAAVLLAQQQQMGQHMVQGPMRHHAHAAQDADDERAPSRGGRTRSGDSRSSSAYASRHQQAEARRRTRINERLDNLRQLVPHAERANTATFLEEVIKYIQVLQSRNTNLERMIRDLQQAPLPGQGAAASTPAMIEAAAAAAAAAAAGQFPGQQQQGAVGLPLQLAVEPLTQQQQQPQQPLQSQQHLLRSGTAGSSGSLGLLAAGQQDTAATQQQQGFAGAVNPLEHLLGQGPQAARLQHHQDLHAQDAAAQSGAAALLAAAGATAALGAGSSAAAAAAQNEAATNSSGAPSAAAAAAAAGAAGGGSSGAAGSGDHTGSGTTSADAARAAAAAAVAAPSATVQVPDVLQSMLPQGLDLQQMLQQALLSTQAQLLAQLQQHHQQTSSGTGTGTGTGATAGAANTGTGAGAAATSSGGTSGQPATSTAPLSALQQAVSGPQQTPSSTQQRQSATRLQRDQLLQKTAGLLGSPPSLVLPRPTQVETVLQQLQPAQQAQDAVSAAVSAALQQQQLLQPAPALNILQQQQNMGTAGMPASTAGLQTAGLLAINQLMAQLRGSNPAAQQPAAVVTTTALVGHGGGDAAAAAAGAGGGGGGGGNQVSPSAAGGPAGGAPACRAAAATVAGRAASSGGDGNGCGGGAPSSLPNLLAMAAPAGMYEQRSSSMSGEREDEGGLPAKMLVL